MSALKRITIAFTCALLAILMALLGYLSYLELTYYRIADDTATDIENQQDAMLDAGTSYTAVTYNIGFGAYGPDFSFFMDEGVMADGTKTQGTHGTATSQESVLANTQGSIDVVSALDPDFVLLQECDVDSDRSYHVNQKDAFTEAFSDMGSTFATAFHSSYLFYPFNDPHGTVNSGQLTLSSAAIATAVRKSYPVSDDAFDKLFDLDRCFEVATIPVNNGKQLVLINSHMSAYDEGGTIRAQQLDAINAYLAACYERGDYVILGGDFNHALCGSEGIYASQQQVPAWIQTLSDADLADHFAIVRPDNLEDVATCRGSDIPYEKGVNYTSTVDGFIVSDNVTATATNVDAGFAYSDHNPVKLTFTLND